MISFNLDAQVPISHDALRMRLRRLCQKKKSGRCNVSDSIISDYVEAGEKREILEIALLESVAKHGVDRTSYGKVRAPLLTIFYCWSD